MSSKTASLMTLWLSKTFSALTPMGLSISILCYSIVTAFLIFKSSLTSWMPFVLIMIFSTGMMTLFIYVASLTPNEKSKSKNSFWIFPVLLMGMNTYLLPSKGSSQSMKMFSSLTLISGMALVLILTMVSLALQSFDPNQSMSSTF